MEAAPIHWWPAVVSILLGLLAGGMLVTGLPPGAPTEAVSQRQRRRDDEDELSATLQSLHDLEERRPSLTSAFYEEEKHRLESRAVELVKRTRAPLPSPATTRQSNTHGDGGVLAFLYARPLLRQGLWGVLTVVIAGTLYANLQSASVQQGGTVQGAPMAAGAPGEGIDDKELDALRERLQQNPEDVAALLRVAHLALRAQQFEQAELFNQRAMALAPTSLEGRVHQAMFLAKEGEADQAKQALIAITKEDPSMAEAWFFQGMLGMQAGDMTAMKQAFEQFVLVAPDGAQKDRVRAMLERSKT